MTSESNNYLPRQLQGWAQRLGAAFGDFLADTARQAQERHSERVFFLSREGHWFAKTYMAMRERTPEGHLYPPAVHLPVSRRATFLPSLDRVDGAALEPLLAQYRSASIHAVLTSLGWFESASSEQIQALSARVDLNSTWADIGPELLTVLSLQEVLDLRRIEQRELLLQLLASHGFVAGGSPVTVADIGWRGSIQDNLTRLLPDCSIHGCYFLLQPAFTSARAQTSKTSFLLPPGYPDRDRLRRRLRFAAPLELLVSPEQGSVTGYRQGPNGPVPLLDERPLNTRSVASKLEAFRSAMAKAAYGDGFHRRRERQVGSREVLQDVLRFLEAPPMAFAELYFETLRDESFGTGRLVEQAPSLNLCLLIGALWSDQSRRRLGYQLAESGWPWALLKRDLPLLAPLLRNTVVRLDPRLS